MLSFQRVAPLFVLAVLFAAPPARADFAWRTWDDGLREAAASRKPMLVDVYTDWCGWCRRMQRDVYARADVRAALERDFVTVKLNAESRAAARYESRALTEQGLAARFRVSGYPTTVFLKPDGSHLVNVPGYVPPERFLLLLRFVGDGHLERGRSFDEFVRAESARSPSK
jgi:thioredoxin-related protein